MAGVFDRLVIELWGFIAPVRRATANGQQLAAFLNRFGYQLSPTVWDAAVADLADLRGAIEDFSSALAAIPDLARMSQAESADLAVKASAIFDRLTSIGTAGSQMASLGITAEFFGEVCDALLHDYLALRVPVLQRALLAIEALVIEDAPASSPDGRMIDYVRIRFDWARLGQFVDDTGTWAREVYGWGTDFRYTKALVRLAQVLDLVGPPSHFEEIPASQLQAFLRNVPAPVVSVAPPRHDLVQIRLPIYGEAAAQTDAHGFAALAGEVGVVVMPYGDLNRRDQMGLALAPYVSGGADGAKQLTPNLSLHLSVDAEAAGGAVLVVRPGEVTVDGNVAVDARFELGLRYVRSDGTEVVLLGEAGGTRLAGDAVVLAFGGSLNGDLFLAGGVQQLRLVIDLSKDGFLGSVISEPITVDAGDVLIGWRPNRGVYFEGGTSLGVNVPLNLQLGPITILEVGLRLDWAGDLRVTFTVTGEATIGPLYASIEGLGLTGTAVRSTTGTSGAFGKYDLTFGVEPPTGYAVSLDGGAIKGGGLLAVYDHEYRGALALQFQSFGLAAFAILTTQLPGGRDGFSFVASIFGQFSLPLGYGFFLTAAGGIIGINRTVDTDALRAVLFEGRFDALLFPEDPIASAATVLDDLAEIFPVREGQYLFGPVARIGWGQPALIEGKLGVIIEVGDNTRLLILGGLAVNLPTKDAALVSLKLSFFGEIDFAAGTISFDASLASSRILTWPISGDAAVRTGWAARLDHVASFGGVHPLYPRPASLPDLRRMSISFGTNNPRVTLSAYAAVTLGSLQFGARADLYARGPEIPLVGQVAAEGWAYFDALITFNPFGFDVALGGGLQLLVDGEVVAGLGFDLRLTGPNPFHIQGRVWVTVCGIDIDFEIEHRWGTRQTLPAATADPLLALRQAIEQSAGFEPLPARARVDAVVFASDDAASVIDPAGGVRFTQPTVPLDVTIDKVGEAHIAGSFKRFDLKVFEITGAAAPVTAAQLDFVRSHFWTLSDAEKLRTPAFEAHEAGFDIAADVLVVDESLAIEATFDYEVVRIDTQDSRTTPTTVLPHGALSDAFARRWNAVYHAEVAEPPDKFRGFVVPAAPVSVRDPAYVTAQIIKGAAPATTARPGTGTVLDALMHSLDALDTDLSLTGVRQTAGGRDGGAARLDNANVVVADYIAASVGG